jgi:hypothetical protein
VASSDRGSLQCHSSFRAPASLGVRRLLRHATVSLPAKSRVVGRAPDPSKSVIRIGFSRLDRRCSRLPAPQRLRALLPTGVRCHAVRNTATERKLRPLVRRHTASPSMSRPLSRIRYMRADGRGRNFLPRSRNTGSIRQPHDPHFGTAPWRIGSTPNHGLQRLGRPGRSSDPARAARRDSRSPRRQPSVRRR